MPAQRKYIIILILTVFLFGSSFAQTEATTDFYDSIKAFDLSTILMADSIMAEDAENGKEKFKRGEILGFIGDDYQRFFIHFISVIQNPTNPYEYFAYGKTKVKETICSFQGTITIRQASIYNNSAILTHTQGFASCDVVLYEDKKQPSTGLIKGTLNSKFLIDDQEQFRYDAFLFNADGFSNNQFTGLWTSYKTNTSKKCHWGDYRIPNCGDLDIGTGEFSVADEYLKNGWQNHRLAYETYPETPDGKKAKLKENEPWWK